MVMININDTDYDIDKMTDAQKSLAGLIQLGQDIAWSLEAELAPLLKDVSAKRYSLQCINAVTKAQSSELEARLTDGKEE
jgi:hypothetical protein|tara:strand:+ start:248 stop:487 length:240 start_codon:yes stop_codon:yes gene_type:complete